MLRRPAASNANPPTANKANVAGSGVGTAVLLMFVVKPPEVSDAPGLMERLIVLIRVNSPLNAAKLAPTELYAMDEEGEVGEDIEFSPIAPESWNASVLGIDDTTELLKSTV